VTDSDLAAAGERALAEIEALFHRDVRNDDHGHGWEVISEILKACGWTWPEVYPYHGTVQYCALTTGYSWAKAGLDPKWLAVFFASTQRLDAWASYRPWNEHRNSPPPEGLPMAPKPPAGTLRLIAKLDAHSTAASLPFTPRPGDIVTIGDGTPPEGDHALLMASYDAERGSMVCYSGNGRGIGPDGKVRTGIVRSEVRIGGPGYCVRRVVRPGDCDLIRP
jgi:hypothetical protein